MLIEFVASNFRSIKDEVVLTMLPENKIKDETNLLLNTNIKQVPRLQKLAIIYGANASGKSNLLEAISVMRGIVLSSAKNTIKNQPLPYDPFKLNSLTLNEPTVFSVQFIAKDSIRYHYGFAYDKQRIVAEFLDAYPKGHKQSWFERKWKDEEYEYSFGSYFSIDKDLRNKTRENTLFLSKASDDNNKLVEPVWEWFQDIAIIRSSYKEKTSDLCKTEEGKSKVLKFLKDADIPIDGISITKRRRLSDDSNNEDVKTKELSDALENMMSKLSELTGKNFDDVEEPKFLRSVEGSSSPVSFDFNDESDGTQKLFELAALWIEATEKQVPLFYDELDTSLHPNLQKYLVSKFLGQIDSKAQLIFTSHNTNFLKSKKLRRDLFWFVELKSNRSTDLFPLTAVRESSKTVRKGEAREKGYLDGRYGAVPYLLQED